MSTFTINNNNETLDCRLLITDDEPRLANSLQSLLKVHGYLADIALGGEDAIHQLHKNHYDILLLDLMMPRVTGHHVLEYIQKNQINIITIVVSGETSIDDISLAIRRGAHDYLKKPYIADELLTTIRNAIRKKRLEDANRVMQSRLNRSEKLHRFLVNNSPDIIFILDHTGCFSFINDKIATYTSDKRNDLYGRHFTSIIEKDDIDKANYFLDYVKSANNNHRSINISLNLPSNYPKKRHFELTIWQINDPSELNNEENNRYHIYGTARDISEQVEAEEFINFQAYHDILTRLPNRSLFKDRLNVAIAQSQRNNKHLAVMFIDLDRFKIINDSLGHTMGDRLLQAVSQRLMSCIRKVDTLSRFGGDEFTLLLPDIQNEESTIQVAEKILESIKQPFNIAGHELYVGASIGIAIYPDAGENLDTLIKNADIAMYSVKKSGKDGYQLFSPEMNNNLTHRISLEQDLRKALQNDEFDVYYQPLIDTKTEGLHGVEALIRWNHPRYGLLSPAQFIPIAEESRLIIDIDRHTLKKACTQIAALHRKGHKDLRLSINISPIMVERDDFVESIQDTLISTNFPANCLELEITEGLLLSDRKDTIEKLAQLSNFGLTLAIDDFGTGYSSLSYLNKFPISTLKIDRSFIHKLRSNTDEACIVNAIVSMAHGLKMKIIAEGVEHVSQLTYLRTLGCNVVQGFLFGKATALDELMLRYPLKQPHIALVSL